MPGEIYRPPTYRATKIGRVWTSHSERICYGPSSRVNFGRVDFGLGCGPYPGVSTARPMCGLLGTQGDVGARVAHIDLPWATLWAPFRQRCKAFLRLSHGADPLVLVTGVNQFFSLADAKSNSGSPARLSGRNQSFSKLPFMPDKPAWDQTSWQRAISFTAFPFRAVHELRTEGAATILAQGKTNVSEANNCAALGSGLDIHRPSSGPAGVRGSSRPNRADLQP